MNKTIYRGAAVQLLRDCEAILVPSAKCILMDKGTVVTIQQILGGNITVVIEGNLARIDSDNLDALGFETDAKQHGKVNEELPVTGVVVIQDIWEQLKTCYDPEIPVNIVDLGLIYKCEVVDNKDKLGSMVNIDLTLTAPGCAMGPVFLEDIKIGRASCRERV